MIDFFSSPIMIRAIIAGLVLSVVAGFYGVFIVQRKMSFLGAGLGHAAFGGIALGLYLGVQPLWIAIPFTLIIASGISWLKRKTLLSTDTVIGIFFSVSVALGIVLLTINPHGSGDAYSYLFGSILAISPTDLWASFGLLLVAGISFITHWGAWAYATFDDEAAEIAGLRTSKDDMLLTVLIALTMVVSIKVVGILLVSAWMVLPAAAARLVSQSFRSMTLIAIGASMLATALGLGLSWVVDLPSGAVIVLVQVILFGIALGAQTKDS